MLLLEAVLRFPNFLPLAFLGATPDWEVLNGVGVDGVGGVFPFLMFFFFTFLVFLCFSLFFFVFLCFSSLFFAFFRFSWHFSSFSRTRANDCNLLAKWGLSLRPRLHHPVRNFPTEEEGKIRNESWGYFEAFLEESPQQPLPLSTLPVGGRSSDCVHTRPNSRPCKTCTSAAVKNCPEIVRGSRHGKCCEISGGILLFLFPQETKLESAQIFSRQISHHFSADALQLQMPNGVFHSADVCP